MAPDGSANLPHAESADARPGVSTSPVAVVWCRQVDNEAESPGYTTVPEDFPGHRETLEVIRTVGNLTVNVADTHDYWDPDPSQPLSYYPNLFLYPAYGGRYICVGRMFLSTEDRPRLGMKTLVLDTAQLLASGEFGATILRWHASMGGPRREGARPPAVPDPALYHTVGEGFLFHRGSTDPVVLVASDDWESVMAAILDLVRLLPASLISLGAILAFPYFLPQPKTNLHEFTEQLPLALALMRVPRGEAAGERHVKRMSSWESAPVTLRDLTPGLSAQSKGKENVPLILQYARDHQDAKLLPISRRVDLVEGPRVKAHLADPERQGGRDRRKEMWRIGTAMESAALLLQRARGRHVPVNVETAKRAQEYLQARVPDVDPRQPLPEPAIVAPAVVAGPPGQVPPWLQRPKEPVAPPPAAPSTPEVVPVSKSDDPSLLPPAPPPAATPPVAPPVRPIGGASSASGSPAATFPAATPPIVPLIRPAPAPAPQAAAAPPQPPTPILVAPIRPAPPAIDVVALKIQIEGDLLRLLEERIRALANSAPPPGPATALDGKLTAELDARADARIAAAVQQLNAQMNRGLDSLDARQNQAREDRLAQVVRPPPPPGPASSIDPRLQAELDARTEAKVQAAVAQLSTQISRGIEGAEARQTQAREERLAAVVKPPPPPGPAMAVDPKLQAELDARTDSKIQGAVTELSSRFNRDLEAVGAREAKAREERLAAVVRPPPMPGPATAIDPKLQAELDAKTEARIASAVQQLSTQITRNLQLIEERQNRARDERLAATESRLSDATTLALTAELDQRFASNVEPRIEQLGQRIDELIARSTSQTRDETRAEIGRATDTLRATVAKSEDELRSGLSAQLELHLQEVSDREAQTRETLDGRVDSALAARLAEVESRRAKELKDVEQRLALLIDGRNRDTQDRVSGLTQQQESKLAGLIDERLTTVESRVGQTLETRLTESQEARVHALADLQVRLQSYFEQKLREEQERERAKYLELLARLKGEVESSLARMVDSSRFDSALRDKIGRSLEAFRVDTQRSVDARVASAEQKIQVEQAEYSAQMAHLEQSIEERRGEMRKLEEAIRTDLDDLDRRSQILADRLVPIVRKTWLRVAEIQQSGSSTEAETQMNQLRREMTREVQRLEGELSQRTAEIRDRMETTIAHQGRVWLTLIRQLSALAGDRRGAPPPRSGSSPSPEELDGNLEELPAIYDDAASDDPVNPMDPEPDEDAVPPRRTSSGSSADRVPRRRLRRSSN
jgi:hypothetical protein